MVEFYAAKSGSAKASAFIITSEKPDYKITGLSKGDVAIAEKLKAAKRPVISLLKEDGQVFIQFTEKKDQAYLLYELCRKAGALLANELRALKIDEVVLQTDSADTNILLAYAEGLALGTYLFEKYKKVKTNGSIKRIGLSHNALSNTEISTLQAVTDATYIVRDLVNEPYSHLNAEQLGEIVKQLGKTAGFKTEVLNKNKIEALKMGGLLGVNQGSLDPPTFSIMEWKPKNAVNKQPVVLIGKGVTYDTGGLTLKPTPGSMDSMKSDMAGGAAVLGTMYAVATTKLPIYVVALIPATDNRPGENAVAPGDIMTMYDGTTVEVLNTDAEGRLILADALTYAKKYKPQLTVDLATLTGAAARAIGHYGIVYMGTAPDEIKNRFVKSGLNTYERLVEFPMWEEYAELLKSDIADIKNVAGGTAAGAITAGKFLEHFTDYPWLHFDIAGPSFITAQDSYRSKNATGVGVRLLYDFLKNMCS